MKQPHKINVVRNTDFIEKRPIPGQKPLGQWGGQFMDGSHIPSMGSTIHMRGSLSISPGREDKSKSKSRSPARDRKVGLSSKLQRSTTGSAVKNSGVIRVTSKNR